MAFDAHRSGPMDGERICSFPDDANLVERIGDCDVSGPTRLCDVTVYYSAEGKVLREVHGGPQALSPELRQGA